MQALQYTYTSCDAQGQMIAMPPIVLNIDWQINNEQLQRQFKFSNFSQAFAFMTQVALLAEQMDHHPNWSNVYNTVTINLYTHSAHALTIKDYLLAEAIDKL
jgi:4a-hydroxytetrahydrobiopterin dehydratase